MKIFIGPTKPKNIPLDAEVLPPAQQGDIAAAALKGPDTLILIDGVFHQSLAPWHKEILFALDRGCRVIGAGSLGALRAVECARYGAEPVGMIAQWYADEVCTDDADVAVAHSTADMDYKSLTVPLVNLRATLDALCADGLLSAEKSRTFLKKLEGIYYVERSWGAVCKVLGDHAALLQENYIDQKSLDAEAAITHALSTQPPTRRDTPATIYSAHLLALLGADTPNGDGVRPYEVTPQKDRTATIDQVLVAYLGSLLGINVDESQIRAASTAMWHRLGINNPEQADDWLTKHNVTSAAWYDEAQREATRQSVRDWWSATNCDFDLVPLTTTHQLLNK